MSAVTEKTCHLGEKTRLSEILFGTLLALGSISFIWISATLLIHLSAMIY